MLIRNLKIKKIYTRKLNPYIYLFFTGASDEARTRYLHLGKVALYQMSYTRSDKIHYSISTEKVNTFLEKNKSHI